MNNTTSLLKMLSLSAILAGALLFSGCPEGPDTSDAANYFNDNPYQSLEQQVALATFYAMADPTSLTDDGDTTTLTAVGGTPPYIWTVYSNAYGIIVATYGDTAVYRRLTSGDNIVALQDARGIETYVSIVQPGGLVSGGFSLFLSTTTLGSGASATVSVLGSGGVPPYSFFVENSLLGTISPATTTNNIATYTRPNNGATSAGTNRVSVSDSVGRTTSTREIVQP